MEFEQLVDTFRMKTSSDGHGVLTWPFSQGLVQIWTRFGLGLVKVWSGLVAVWSRFGLRFGLRFSLRFKLRISLRFSLRLGLRFSLRFGSGL